MTEGCGYTIHIPAHCNIGKKADPIGKLLRSIIKETGGTFDITNVMYKPWLYTMYVQYSLPKLYK